MFEEQSSATFIPGATQCNLQAMIDNRHYSKLLASATIRNQACLTVLSHPSGASSGWLKAIPQSSLSLAIHGPEFVVDLCL